MGSNISEEKVQKIIQEQTGEGFEALVRRKIEKRLIECLDSDIAEIVQKVQVKLDQRGIDIDQMNVDLEEVVANQVLAELLGRETSKEVVEISVAGRTNQDHSSKVVVDTEREPETYTEEVPIEGGEDPETIEVERIERPVDPRLNTNLDSFEISRAFKQGLTPKMMREGYRANEDSNAGQEEEYDLDDISPAGLPWYQ